MAGEVGATMIIGRRGRRNCAGANGFCNSACGICDEICEDLRLTGLRGGYLLTLEMVPKWAFFAES